jgi:hypothetical protein
MNANGQEEAGEGLAKDKSRKKESISEQAAEEKGGCSKTAGREGGSTRHQAAEVAPEIVAQTTHRYAAAVKPWSLDARLQ